MVEPTRRRSQRRRRVDEQFELGPAIRLVLDAPGVGVGQVVDGDPVPSLTGGAAQELPGLLGLGRQRALEEAEREPARFEVVVAQEAIGHEQERAERVAPRGGLEPARDRAHQRPADAVGQTEARRDDVLAVLVLRIGQRAEAVGQAGGERLRVLAQVGELGAEALGGLDPGGDEGHRPLGGRAGRDARAPARSPRRAPVRGDSARGAGACAPRPPPRRRRSRSPARSRRGRRPGALRCPSRVAVAS